ncbi:MAG: hypothetical protein K5694_05280 [Bacilli bacterium]|nr:hypothetical protein [Bacilli bacterium]
MKFPIPELEACFNNVLPFLDIDLEQEAISPETLNKEIDLWLQSDNEQGECFNDFYWGFIKSDKKRLIKVLTKYYEISSDLYDYLEYGYSRFDDDTIYLSQLDPFILYLSGKYFDINNEPEKAKKSYLIALCSFKQADMNCLNYDEDIFVRFYSLLEDKFDDISEILTEDWLALHPLLVSCIGRYYLIKKDYEKAAMFFEKGDSFDYFERQSLRPYINISNNTYELGMMYLDGLYFEKNYSTAIEYFERVCQRIGLDSLPIMGDIYYYGLGVEKDPKAAIYAYVNSDQEVLTYYNVLRCDQEERLKILCDDLSKNEDLSFDELRELEDAYKHIISEFYKSEEISKRIHQKIMDTPVSDRTDEMNAIYIDYVVKDLDEKLSAPKNNTGSIPENPKVGDIFIFGAFNGEPIEWKVWAINDDGSIYVVSTKIIFKIGCQKVINWLNHSFIDHSFSAEERKHIVGQIYPPFNRYEKTYIYLPSSDQFMQFEGEYPEGTIKETELAKNLSKNKRVLCGDARSIMENGELSRVIDRHNPYGIRPAMDIKIKID